MKKISFIFISFFIFQVNVYASKQEVLFKRCIDGDTAVFTLNDIDVKVRFLAIDTPETVHPSKDATLEGQKASDYTCNKISNANKLELEYDVNSDKTDKYKRDLAWIWVDDYLLQKELVELGFAEVKYIYGDYLYTDELYLAQESAIKDKVGIWNDYNFKSYIVTFDEGDFEKKVIVSEHSKVKSYQPNKKGYKFKGWYHKNNLYDFNNYITKDIKLIAEYQKVYSFAEVFLGISVLLIIFITNKSSFKRILKKKLKKII